MRALFCLLLIAGLSGSAFAQKGEKPLSDSKKKQLAEQLLESGSYYNANDLFQELYEANPKVGLAWSIATCYFESRDYPNALTWYQKVWDESPGAYPEAQYQYALCLKLNGRYDEALAQFEDFRKNTSIRGAEGSEMKRMAKNEAAGCELAKLIMAEPIDMDINPMGPRINAPYTEFGAWVLNDDEFLYSSLRTDSVVVMGPNKKTTMRSKIYRSKRSGGVWGQGEEYDDNLNGVNGHVGNPAISPDGKTMYFTVCNPSENVAVMICEIYTAELGEDGWGKPKKASELNEAGYTSTHPTFASQDRNDIIYFASDRPGGRGGMDIWYATVTNRGVSSPRNAGPKLNTSNDEITPFWNAQEEMLYFSSNGHVNIGGLDVFKAEGRERSWKTPLNVGYPVNSNVDDFGYVAGADGEKGFLISNREGAIALKNAYCCDDVFRFEYIFPPEFAIMGNVYVKGAEEATPLADAFVMLGSSAKARMDSTISAAGVPYEFFLGTMQDNFELRATKAGFTADRATVSTKGLTESDTLYVDLYLEPIDTTRAITIKDIYYELDKADLRPESKKGLDSLYAILMAYPTIQIEISSHTDSRGSAAYNVDLSQRRAESVVRYLTSVKGIPGDRLVAKGYGETKLLNECADGESCSEEQHQINRRTEFRILGQMPGTVVTYDKATIDAMRALERERGSLDNRIKELMEQGQLDEIEEEVGSGVIDREAVEEEAPVRIDTENEVEEAVEETMEAAETAALSNTVTRKGNFFFGQAMVNGTAQVEYMFDARRPVAFVSGDLFVQLRDAGTVSTYNNSTAVELPDGSQSQGDVFVINTLQLGSSVFTNVEAKLNARMSQPLVVGQKLLDTQKCKYNLKKMELECK
jgi:outer membrane protein OmpA-like peptidoglycan-associated protein